MYYLRLFILLAASLTFPLVAGFSQEVVPTVAAPVVLPDNDLRSPRQTVSTFLSSMDPSDGELEIARAIKTLDTSEIPELVRQERSEEVALKLYAVLSSIGFSSSNTKAPVSSEEEAIQLAEVAGYGIHLARSGPNWQFSKTTVADVPLIFREVEPTLSKRKMRALGEASHAWLTLRTYIPQTLKKTTLLIEDWQWLAGALAIVILGAVQILAVRLLRFLIRRLAPRGFEAAHSNDVKALGRPIFVILFTIALQLLMYTLDLEVDIYTSAVAWISTVRIVAFAILGIYLVETIGERLLPLATRTSASFSMILFPLVQKALWVLVIIITAVRILTVHGIDVSGLVAGLGLGGLAFALAAKDTIENIFGSVAILLDQPFRVGDTISVAGVTGTVEEIGLRSTRIRTPDNSLISLPNSKIIAGHVDNLGARRHCRTRIILNIAYTTSPAVIEELCTAIRALLLSHPLTKKDALAVFLNEFNPNGLGVLVQFHLEVSNWIDEQRYKEEIFLAILRAVEMLGVVIAQPPREVASTPEARTDDTAASVRSGSAVARDIKVPWNR